MDKPAISDTLEKAHKTNVERLLLEFGEKRTEEIRLLYQRIRLSDERSAKVKDFIPVIAYRTVREILRTEKRYA